MYIAIPRVATKKITQKKYSKSTESWKYSKSTKIFIQHKGGSQGGTDSQKGQEMHWKSKASLWLNFPSFCSCVILVKRELKISNKQDDLYKLWAEVKMKCRVPV